MAAAMGVAGVSRERIPRTMGSILGAGMKGRLKIRLMNLLTATSSYDINHNYIINNNLKRNKYLRLILGAIKIAGDSSTKWLAKSNGVDKSTYPLN